jgi:hypothetical protein
MQLNEAEMRWIMVIVLLGCTVEEVKEYSSLSSESSLDSGFECLVMSAFLFEISLFKTILLLGGLRNPQPTFRNSRPVNR